MKLCLKAVVYMMTYTLLDLEARDRDEALRLMAETMERAGAVKPGYGEAVVQRESQFPTGLPTGGMHTAIPHASATFANFSALLFCRLKEPVQFVSMEDENELLSVRLIFMLALKDSSEHTAVLRRLMQIFQKTELLQALCGAQDDGQLSQILAID